MSLRTSRPNRDAEAGIEPGADGTYGFFALACAWTWILALPVARAWIRHQAPPPGAVACAGLSAFGPLVAALVIAGRRQQLRDVFGRWRTNPVWIGMALVTPAAVHALATAAYVAIGGHPAQWLYPPVTPEQMAALVVFPLGEEFGWRGLAQPRMARRHGLVKGSLLVGLGWGLWHLLYTITPQAAGFDPFELTLIMAELPLYSLLIAWVFERSNRSMAVAIAFHAGAHLDHFERAPRTDLRLHALHLAVLAVLAILAARALATRERARPRPPG
jgi:membrane protease YdiL (CAAX protease family)